LNDRYILNVKWLKAEPRRPLRRRGDVAFIVGRARLAGPALGARGIVLDGIGDGVDPADRRRQRVERDAFDSGVARTRSVSVVAACAIGAVAITGRAGIARSAFVALRPFGAFGTLGALKPLAGLGTLAITVAIEALVAIRTLGTIVVAAIVLRTLLVAGLHLVLVALVVVAVIAAGSPLLLEAGAAFAEHAVIMVGVLEIIFGLDAIPAELRVARHALVFFQELRGVASLAIVLTIAVRPAAQILRPLASTAATPATLSIIDQMLLPQSRS
jgi:hypothetical protein